MLSWGQYACVCVCAHMWWVDLQGVCLARHCGSRQHLFWASSSPSALLTHLDHTDAIYGTKHKARHVTEIYKTIYLNFNSEDDITPQWCWILNSDCSNMRSESVARKCSPCALFVLSGRNSAVHGPYEDIKRIKITPCCSVIHKFSVN